LGSLPRNGTIKIITIVKKTLILDLDETLVHCNQVENKEWDHIIEIEFPNSGLMQVFLLIIIIIIAIVIVYLLVYCVDRDQY